MDINEIMTFFFWGTFMAMIIFGLPVAIYLDRRNKN